MIIIDLIKLYILVDKTCNISYQKFVIVINNKNFTLKLLKSYPLIKKI